MKHICYNCGELACAENGDHHWYCFRCFMELFSDEIDECEIDNSLRVCSQELKLQASVYSV